MFLITFDWAVSGDLSLVATHLFKWVMISLLSPSRLPPLDPPRILAMSPRVLSVFTVIPLRYSSFRSSLQFLIVYFTTLVLFSVFLSPPYLTSPLSVFLFLTRISEPLQTV